MEAKEIRDKEILTEGVGKGCNSVTNLQSSFPRCETLPSLDRNLTIRQSCRLPASELWGRLLLGGVLQWAGEVTVVTFFTYGIIPLKFSESGFGSVCQVIVADNVFFPCLLSIHSKLTLHNGKLSSTSLFYHSEVSD